MKGSQVPGIDSMQAKIKDEHHGYSRVSGA